MRKPRVSKAIRPRRGTASVEFAMVVPVLLFFLFGTLEFGFMVGSSETLWNLAREAGRAAAVGSTPTQISSQLEDSKGCLDWEALAIKMEYRATDLAGNTMWLPLEDDGIRNTAPYGSLVRVTLDYEHSLLMPGLFGKLLASGSPDASTQTKVLSSSVTTRRE